MTIGFDASRAFEEKRSGTENYSYQLLRALLKIDRKNKYIVYVRRQPILQGETFKGRPNVWVKQLRWPRLWTQGGLALATWKDNLDLLFVPAHTLPVLRRSGLPTVVTIHGLEYEYLPEHYKVPQKYYLTSSTRYAVNHSSQLIAVSQFTKDDLIRRLGAESEKITVVSEGVDAKRFGKKLSHAEKGKMHKDLGITSPYVLFVGVIQPRKNLVRLIEAFARLKKHETKTDIGNVNLGSRSETQHDDLDSLALVIAGKLGWMYDDVLRMPGKLGVADQVKFIGFVEDEHLPVLFQEAELYVQPSLTEGFGLPVLEAMAARTPVVSSRAGALAEVVGNAGLLVEPTSVDELSEAMKLVLSSQELREGLVEKGLRRVKQFTWERTARATLSVFESAVRQEK